MGIVEIMEEETDGEDPEDENEEYRLQVIFNTSSSRCCKYFKILNETTFIIRFLAFCKYLSSFEFFWRYFFSVKISHTLCTIIYLIRLNLNLFHSTYLGTIKRRTSGNRRFRSRMSGTRRRGCWGSSWNWSSWNQDSQTKVLTNFI